MERRGSARKEKKRPAEIEIQLFCELLDYESDRLELSAGEENDDDDDDDVVVVVGRGCSGDGRRNDGRGSKRSGGRRRRRRAGSAAMGKVNLVQASLVVRAGPAANRVALRIVAPRVSE